MQTAGAHKMWAKVFLIIFAVGGLVLLGLLLTFPYLVADPDESWAVVTSRSGKILRVSSEGAIEVVRNPPPQTSSGDIAHGTTGPVPSPNHQLVAFTRENDLWVLDLHKNQEIPATSVGKPWTESHAAVFVYITGWSWDSRHILYSLTHGETEDPEGWHPTLKVHPAEYGFYIYDLETRMSRPVRVPGRFFAWLPGGDFLLHTQPLRPTQDHLLRFTPGDGSERAVGSPKGWYGQMDVSPDGQWLLTSLGQEGASGTKSQILKIDLDNGEATPVTPLGKWAEYQWPRFSPTASHVAYFWKQGRDASGYPKGTLVVDGQPIFPYVGYPNYRWIDDHSIVVWQRGKPEVRDGKVITPPEKFTVLDAETGRAKSQRTLP